MGRLTKVLLALGLLIGLLVVSRILYIIGEWLWGELYTFIQPRTATDKKDLVNIFVLIAAGVVGSLTAIAAIGNLIISRKNLQNAQATLQQQRVLEDQRAQESTLQAYYGEMTQLVRDGLRDEDPSSPIRLLTRGRTLNVFWQLDSGRKRALLQMLHEAGLISRDNPIIDLSGADLREAYLWNLDLRNADLRGADMKSADLSEANLSGADLRGSMLGGADLRGAYLSGADLWDAREWTEDQLTAAHLEGTTMPNGQKYEDWLKRREEDGG